MGRNRELQAIIEASDESASERRALHLAVVGDAGMGKSRLVWEYFKHVDGIEQVRYWHQGRCLAYGEGVAYWALAEMVRARARILEEDEPAVARQKLREVIERFVSDERERRLVEPRRGGRPASRSHTRSARTDGQALPTRPPGLHSGSYELLVRERGCGRDGSHAR